MNMRIAKFIAESGAASRRVAENLITDGRVTLNGNVVTSPVTFVADGDSVAIDGKILRPRNTTELYAFHKPINTMTTTRDPMGRKTIYDCLSREYKNLKYVGRLDFKTTGLLLLTNDGELARKLTLPASHIPREYIATVSRINESELNSARRGMTVDGIKYRPMQIEVIDNKTLRVRVTEGKKNEVRIVLRACACPVVKLHRVSFGPVQLGNLSVGKIQKIEQKTIDALLKTL